MKGVECNFGNGIDANFYTQNIPTAKNVDLNLKKQTRKYYDCYTMNRHRLNEKA